MATPRSSARAGLVDHLRRRDRHVRRHRLGGDHAGGAEVDDQLRVGRERMRAARARHRVAALLAAVGGIWIIVVSGSAGVSAGDASGWTTRNLARGPVGSRSTNSTSVSRKGATSARISASCTRPATARRGAAATMARTRTAADRAGSPDSAAGSCSRLEGTGERVGRDPAAAGEDQHVRRASGDDAEQREARPQRRLPPRRPPRSPSGSGAAASRG